MAEDFKLTASVTIDNDKFYVGDAKSNSFSVTITNKGPKSTTKLANNQFFFLDSLLGSDTKALFLKEADVKGGVLEIELEEDWRSAWDFQIEKPARLQLFPPKSFTLKKDESLVIVKLSKVISKTAPGEAVLTFGSSVSSETVDLPIPKITDGTPDIIFFTSTPEEGVFNLPGDTVTLQWCTYKLDKCQLTRVGSSTPLYTGGLENRETMMIEGTKQIDCGESDSIYSLNGDPGNVQRKLVVHALKEGWQGGKANKLFKGDPGDSVLGDPVQKYPIDLQPTVLFNANDVDLYAIFRHDGQDCKRSLLFRTSNPFGDWQLVDTQLVPEAFATSPGVHVDDKLWLIGGSVVDPDNTSNHVWRFDTKKDPKTWQSLENAPWQPRMGHAALKFGNEIWIMGGRDEAGNALNDVWALDLKNLSWRQVGDAPWSPRCLFHPAVVEKNQIWLYGGAEEPFSETLYDDLWVYENEEWTERGTQKLKALDTNPIAAGLQTFKGKLHLIGQFRTQSTSDTSEVIDTLAFSLEGISSNTWKKFPTEKLKNWGAITTFNLQLVNFRDRMLIANALSYEPMKTDLQIYVK